MTRLVRPRLLVLLTRSAAGYASTGFTSATTNVLKYIDFASAIGALDPAYQQNAVWAMSNATLGYVIGLVDAQGRPLFLLTSALLMSGFVGTILGQARSRLSLSFPPWQLATSLSTSVTSRQGTPSVSRTPVSAFSA